MSDANRLDRERASLECVAGRDGPQIGGVVEFSIGKAPAGEGERHVGAINGNVEAAQEMGQRADVILVGVGEDDGFNRDAAALEPGISGMKVPRPSAGSSGNMTPQSMTIARPAHSIAIKLRPISPSPPRATIRTGAVVEVLAAIALSCLRTDADYNGDNWGAKGAVHGSRGAALP